VNQLLETSRAKIVALQKPTEAICAQGKWKEKKSTGGHAPPRESFRFELL
jgi:hypothetical protein